MDGWNFKKINIIHNGTAPNIDAEQYDVNNLVCMKYSLKLMRKGHFLWIQMY